MNHLVSSFQHSDNVGNKNPEGFCLKFNNTSFSRNVSYLSTWNLKTVQKFKTQKEIMIFRNLNGIEKVREKNWK